MLTASIFAFVGLSFLAAMLLIARTGVSFMGILRAYMGFGVACVAALLMMVYLSGCWGHKANQMVVTGQVSEVKPTDDPITVQLMDSNHNVVWTIKTTKSHVIYLTNIGKIQVDGQTWDGPYKVKGNSWLGW
jgi:hypothetical protein